MQYGCICLYLHNSRQADGWLDVWQNGWMDISHKQSKATYTANAVSSYLLYSNTTTSSTMAMIDEDK